MIPRECKRLAEVDFPIAAVSKHAAREKSIRHGHPSTLHLWWARRPLASSRAVLLAPLLPDPCDPLCPEAFKRQATEILTAVRQPPADDAELRRALLWFIAAFANWDMAAHPTYLQAARNLVRAAHADEAPLVVDPFAGGGSIPLEALRLGCEAFASDLNPVACLILKVMLEDIPRHGPKPSRRAATGRRSQIKAAVGERARRPLPGGSGRRDVRSPISGRAPCVARRQTVGRRSRSCARSGCARRPRGSGRYGTGWSGPRRATRRTSSSRCSSRVRARKYPDGTVSRARARCPLLCRTVLAPERVRAQLAVERGGADAVFDKLGPACRRGAPHGGSDATSPA